jgi:UDP-glucose 4-epimerase
MASRVVLITGVADYWGSRLAERLVTHPELHVIGVDAGPPRYRITGLDFVQTDVRNPALSELLQAENVHTVCHLKFISSVQPSDATTSLNLGGTQNVLESCARAAVSRIVLKSSLAVYGAHPNNPALLVESDSLRGSPRYGYTRHMVAIEKFCSGFRHEVPGVGLTILRCASIIGPSVDTPLTRLLRGCWVPALLGFDPMFQLLHEDDAVEALSHAVFNDKAGAYNVAAEAPLPFSRVLALAGTIPLPMPHPLANWGLKFLRRADIDVEEYAPIEPDYLRYSWVGDVVKMRQEFGFAPGYTAENALEEFAVYYGHRAPASASEPGQYDEARLRATIRRRRDTRETTTSTTAKGEPNE